MTHAPDDLANDVLVAATYAVEALSPDARRRLAEGVGWVRLPAYEARRLIEAVDELNRAIRTEGNE